MTASPRHRAPCNRHEARAGLLPSYRVVSYGSAIEAWPPSESVSLPACTQRRIRRGAALASSLDPLAFSGDLRGRCKALFYAVVNGTRSQIRNLSIFHATQRTGPTDMPLPSRPQKILYPLVSASPLVLQSNRCSTGFPHAWRTICANLRTPTPLVTIPHSLPRPNNNGACVRRMLRCNAPVCCHPLPSVPD